MSSLRRILSSQANGARSRGPVTVHGKQKSSQNAITHGLLARHIVMRDEASEPFQDVLSQHLDRLQPADGVEFGMVEEMVVFNWRLRRAWAMETRLLENEAAGKSAADPLDRITSAFADLADMPSLGLLQRYQTRLHLNYQRVLHNLLLLRAATAPNNAVPVVDRTQSGPPSKP